MTETNTAYQLKPILVPEMKSVQKFKRKYGLIYLQNNNKHGLKVH